MRSIPSILSSRLKSNIQTRASKSDPSASLWVGRPNTVLVDDAFLERQTVKTASIEDVSIAVCHPKMKKANTKIYMAYISDGTAKVVSANSKYAMAQHSWSDEGFSQTATAVSIAFDGTMPMTDRGDIEFVTEEIPWVFWVNDGMLFAQKLGGETITLAESNCVDISAIRAAWSQASTFDFGLVAFFILGSSLYYRQLINGEWTDAELVSFGPSGVYWAEVSAFRTWDYRVGVQLKSTDGDIYELFTQFMGIGTRNVEHLSISGASRTAGILTTISYESGKFDEHIAINEAQSETIYQGLYTLGIPSLLEVYNTDDGTGDWGKRIVLVFDKELEISSVKESIRYIYFEDSSGAMYYPNTVDMDITGRKMLLSFTNFNNAIGECVMHYSPGTIVTMMEEILSEQECRFTPQNLVPYDADLPEVVEILALNENGTEVSIRFSLPIIGIADDAAEDFIVTINYPIYSPGGKTNPLICPVINVAITESSDTIILYFEDGMETSIRNAVGDVTVHYAGNSLLGDDGEVLGFLKTFTPSGLYMKPNPNDPEHLEIVNATWSATLTTINYRSGTIPSDHIQIAQAMVNSAILTHINEL